MTFLPCLPPSLLLSRGTLEQRGPLSGMRFLLHQSLGLTAAPHFCPKPVWSRSRFFFFISPTPTPTSTPLTALSGNPGGGAVPHAGDHSQTVFRIRHSGKQEPYL